MFTENMVQMSHSTRTYILISVSDSLCSKREASWNFKDDFVQFIPFDIALFARGYYGNSNQALTHRKIHNIQKWATKSRKKTKQLNRRKNRLRTNHVKRKRTGNNARTNTDSTQSVTHWSRN